MDMNLIDILYAFNIFSFLNYFQMRLGTAFGAFLDAVADKVNALFLNMTCIVTYWLFGLLWLSVFEVFLD